MLPEQKELLSDFLKQKNIGNIEYCLQAFGTYMDELVRWNKVVNLTALKTGRDIVIRHFMDSLTPLQFIGSSDFILDIGSGAGFPGLPIKLVLPSVRVVMLDARLKKVNFMNNMIGILKVNGAVALHQRAEAKDFQDIMGGSFDVVISRASFPLTELAGLALPYLKDTGKLIAMKAKIVEGREDMKGLKQTDDFATTLPDGSARRILVFGRHCTPGEKDV